MVQSYHYSFTYESYQGLNILLEYLYLIIGQLSLGWNVTLALVILGQELILYISRKDFWCFELQKAEIVVIKEVALTIDFVVHSIIKMQSLSVLLRLQLKEF